MQDMSTHVTRDVDAFNESAATVCTAVGFRRDSDMPVIERSS